MIENYNSFSYWENIINENKTIRGHMFMKETPTENSFYFHTLIFANNNGINNLWGYCPNIRSLLGYMQYSFLQEAFYKWIYGQEKLITRIPHLTVDKIVKEAEKLNKISKETAYNIKNDYYFLSKLWNISSDKIERELKKFSIEFNRRWMGDNKQFLYIKFFKTPEELGEFVISSTLMTSTEKELENKINMTIDEWRQICKLTLEDPSKGEIFRKILLKNLTEVF